MNEGGPDSRRFCFVMPFHMREGRGGGAEVQAWLLATELARRGFEVSYIAQSVQGKAGQRESIDGVTVRWVRYAHHFRWSNGASYYRALSKLSPDVVVQRMTSFMTGVAGLWCRLNGARFIWVCTDNESPRRWLFWRKQLQLNRKHRPGLAKQGVFLVNALVMDLSRHWGMNQVSQAFTQSEEQEGLLERAFGLTSRRMISGHPVPESVLSPAERLKGGIVLWVADLGPRKRPEKFLELARLGRDYPLRFVMVGGRDDPQYVRALFEDKPDNLEWVGRLPFDETLAWFDRAAFFVNSSKSEGFPNTFIQAWLRGVPVLTLEIDPDGVIARNDLGIVRNDIAGLLGAASSLSGDIARYTEMSNNAVRYAAANHSVEKMADRFIDSLPT